MCGHHASEYALGGECCYQARIGAIRNRQREAGQGALRTIESIGGDPRVTALSQLADVAIDDPFGFIAV